ncbi:hypothetical protein BKA70DRAFT_1099653 [Coprinopsis sp. MPI-PUGE-AT-0042]|nr:hypothetical protein BKA70DRAFT_1099653 [Coprinopsis sp. MPI-PUGE-AT-0042]
MFAVDGVLMFSPNSTRTIALPPPPIENRIEVNPFNRLDPVTNAKPRWEGLLQPRRWTQAFGWMCFIPMSRSHFFCPPFSTLARLPAYHYDEKKYGYMMDPSVCNNWDALADTVLDVAVRLRGHVDRGAVLPHHPRGWGYHKVYQNPRKLQALMHASRDWFLVWMGVISFLVACSIVNEAETNKGKEKDQDEDTLAQREALLRRDVRNLQAWEKMLGEYPHLIPFVEQLGSSPITNFGMPGTPPPCVGLVVDFIQPDHPSQPSIPWLAAKDVPVWYPWNERAHQHALKNGLEKFIPPPHMLQAHHTFLNYQPSLSFPHQPPPSAPAAQFAVDRKQAIDTILAKYEERAAKVRHTWSQGEAQAAAQRERQPATTNAQVELYTIDFESPSKLLRETVVKAAREDTINEHPDNQRRYFPELNLWVCCECMVLPVFVPFTGDDEDDDDTLLNPGPDDIPGPESVTSTVPAITFSQQLTHVSRDPEGFQQSHSSLESFVGEVQGKMYRCYGYVPPLPCPLTKASQPIGSSNEVRLARSIGLRADKTPICADLFQSEAARDMLEFINDITSSHCQIDRCDLEPGNRLYLSSPCLSKLVASKPELKHYWFLFDIEIKWNGSQAWKLALTCASDALMVCRLAASMSWEDIVPLLVQNGVPFQTFQPPRPAISIPYHPLPARLNYRLSKSNFTPQDYDAYEHLRNQMLNHPRMRAALLRGGILWRLAISHLQADDALSGPSQSAQLLSAVHPHTSDRLIDDGLTALEEDLLIGTYVCKTGHGKQVAEASWWPPSYHFEQGDDYGHWTALNEEWFQKRLQWIREGTATPIVRNKWREVLRGRPVSRQLKKEVEKRSRKFINHTVPASHSHLMLESIV